MAKKKNMGTLPESFLFFFFFCLFASVTFRIARVPLHSSIASQSKRFSGYTAYPENQKSHIPHIPRPSCCEISNWWRTRSVTAPHRGAIWWTGLDEDVRGDDYFFFWVVWNVKAERVTFKAFMEDCYLCLVEGFVFSFWFVCLFFLQEMLVSRNFFS